MSTVEINSAIGWVLDEMQDGVYAIDTSRRIVYWNPAAAAITGFSSTDVLGRSCGDNILQHIDEQGRALCCESCPLAATLADGLAREAVVYLHHKAGHRIPVRVCCSPLRNLAGELIGAMELFSDITLTEEMKQRVEELEAANSLDTLTGIANRRYIEDALSIFLSEVRHIRYSIGVLMIDIDEFDALNATHGYAIGDQVLRMVAQTLARNIRVFDVVGRLDRDDFLVILKHVSLEELQAQALRLQKLVAASFIAGETQAPVTITVTIGAALAVATDSAASLLHRAEQIMRHGKACGGNQVVSEVTV